MRLVHRGSAGNVECAGDLEKVFLAGVGVDTFLRRNRVVQATPFSVRIRGSTLLLGEPTVADLFEAVLERGIRDSVGALLAAVLVSSCGVRFRKGALRLGIRPFQSARQLALLGLTGVVTAWLHLKYVAALWTTPYGYALDAKLVVILIVVAFGAWNWRRLTPRLHTEEGTRALRRSSTVELVFAAAVLLITAILVSLPSPKLP